MFSLGAFTAFILSLALVVIADPAITLPDPGHIYNEGGTCQIGWNPDTTGQWKTMNIQLMTGSNGQMVPLTTVATVDGTTSPGTFSYTCPAVTIHAAIYFYQFSHAGNASDLLWTGRFAIADASGTTVAAPNTTQPDGEGIPWGSGALTDPSKAVAPPSYLPGSNGTSPAPASSSGSASSSLAVSSKSLVTAMPSGTSSTGSPSATNSAGNAATSNGSSNGALALGAVSARAAQAGVALAVIAGAFTLMV